MTKVKIYLKSGQVIEMLGENLEINTRSVPAKNLVSMDWSGLDHGENPLFISLSDIAAVTQVLLDPEDD